MLCKRIIAKLEVKNSNLVKGINLEGLRVLGDPQKYAETYFNEGIDEILYNDVVASLYGRNSILELIKVTAQKILIPLTVGGGIRSINDIYDVLENGADKVCINTAAFKRPEFVNEAAKIFGSSTIVSSLEVIKTENKYLLFTDNGREYTGIEVLDWAKKMEQNGVGEILLTSIDKDGTGDGMDIDLIDQLCSIIRVPIIVSGGASKIDHIKSVFQKTKASGIALASMLHYNYFKKNVSLGISKNLDGNRSFLKSKKKFLNFENINITDIKKGLMNSDIKVRSII